MTKIKICGIFQEASAELLNQVQPDMAGIILAPGHRRSVGIMTAMAIRAKLDDHIPLYGVFDDQNVMDILTFYGNGLIQGAQLQDDVSEDAVTLLRDKGVPVIQTRRPEAALRDTSADIVQIDTSAGTGTTFDWQAVPPKPLRKKPLMLAGGLNVDNLADAIAQVQPDWVDISSGAEVDGVKDIALMSQLVAIAHAHE